MRPIQLFIEKTKFLIVFHCIYDVIRLHQVSGSSKYDDVMTKQVPGVSGANLVGRHLPSVPNQVEKYVRYFQAKIDFKVLCKAV